MEDLLRIYRIPDFAGNRNSLKTVNKVSEFHVSQTYSLALPGKIQSISPDEKKIFVDSDLRKYLANSSTARSVLSRCCQVSIIDPSQKVSYDYVIEFIDHEVIVTGMSKYSQKQFEVTFTLEDNFHGPYDSDFRKYILKTKLIPVSRPDPNFSSQNLEPTPQEFLLPCPALCLEPHPALDFLFVGLFGGDFLLISPGHDGEILMEGS